MYPPVVPPWDPSMADDMPLACSITALPTCGVCLLFAGAFFMLPGIAALTAATTAASGPIGLVVFGAILFLVGVICLAAHIRSGPEKAPPLEAPKDDSKREPITALLLTSEDTRLRRRKTGSSSFKQPNDHDDNYLQQTAPKRPSSTSAFQSVYSPWSLISSCGWFGSNNKKPTVDEIKMTPLNCTESSTIPAVFGDL